MDFCGVGRGRKESCIHGLLVRLPCHEGISFGGGSQICTTGAGDSVSWLMG